MRSASHARRPSMTLGARMRLLRRAFVAIVASASLNGALFLLSCRYKDPYIQSGGLSWLMVLLSILILALPCLSATFRRCAFLAAAAIFFVQPALEGNWPTWQRVLYGFGAISCTVTCIVDGVRACPTGLRPALKRFIGGLFPSEVNGDRLDR